MSDKPLYWWSRYGDFDPGINGYPHIGQVIAHYRIKRGFQTQRDLATALGLSKRTIEELEGTMNLDTPDSIERRMVLAKLLRIPPALLALDWRFLIDQSGSAEHLDDVLGTISFEEEETFALYEDLLVMGWEATWRGGIQQFAPRFNRQLERLATLADKSPITEQEQWQKLLCRYYQLSTRFAQRQLKAKQALRDAQSGIEIATQLDDPELMASAYFWRARLHLEQKLFPLAKDDVDAALAYAERIRTPLKGNIYLVAAEVYADGAENNQQMKTQCDRWYEKVANLVYRGGIEEDDSFVKLNVTTTHHERAKTLIQLRRFREARNELNTAWKTLSPDLVIWRINLLLTEARLYFAEKDLEGSAQSAIEALKIAKALQAQDKVSQAHSLYLQLKQHAANNPYVCNLGVQLGVY